jgi:acetylornithine deacetylase/succinyl-diaminopimelate desuccinylase-like protein
MGPVGGRSHSSDEYLELDTLQERYAFLKRVIEGLTNN